MQILDNKKVRELKKRARTAYEEYQRLRERYDCGHAMASYINPDIERWRTEFNDVMDALAEEDSSCPRSRL